jgi:hypothetical protein
MDAAWLLVESQGTPMHVGALLELTAPAKAPADRVAATVKELADRAEVGSPEQR